MFRYLLRRLFVFLPALLAVSLLAFGLSRLAPGDPVELLLRAGAGPTESAVLDAERIYRETAALLGLDKPSFYFSLSSRAYPDTLYRIPHKDHRSTLRGLVAQYGNWEHIAGYYDRLTELDLLLRQLPNTLAPEALIAMRGQIRQLFLVYRPVVIHNLMGQLDSLSLQSPELSDRTRLQVIALKQAFSRITGDPQRHRLYIPDIKWYGLDNQYHHWFVGFVRGDFGISYTDGRPVADKLRDAIRWTLLMNLLAILLAYGLSIPLGVYSAVYRGRRFDRITTVVLFLLYSLPTFWVATIFVVFLTTPEYGLDLFPTMGIGETSPSASFGARMVSRAHHLVLPVFCLTYSSLAFIARQVRGGMVGVIGQDYVRTARAKGLPEGKVIWKHAFRNALFPIITLFGSVFPAMLAGSVVIEVIFNIPGMGKLTIDAINQSNWPVVYAVLMLGAILTMLGMLAADIGYALADPRVSYRQDPV